MKLIEMTSKKSPLPMGSPGNVKAPPGNVDRMERTGWTRAKAPTAKDKGESKK